MILVFRDADGTVHLMFQLNKTAGLIGGIANQSYCGIVADANEIMQLPSSAMKVVGQCCRDKYRYACERYGVSETATPEAGEKAE